MKSVFALLPNSHASNQNICCWTFSEDGQLGKETWSTTDLLAHKGTQCVVVVPGCNLSWLHISLPPHVKLQGDSRSVQLLQGGLEDKLLEEAELVHFALPPQMEAGTTVMVAACNKGWLAQWLQTLEHAGIKVQSVIPEFAADVLGSALWATGQSYDAWIGGIKDGLPVVVPVEAGAAVFSADQGVQALPATYELACQVFGKDRVQLLPEQEWLRALLQTRWNLAQHSFAGSWRERWRRKSAMWVQQFFYDREWRAARGACIALGVGLVVILNVQAWRQTLTMQSQQETMTQMVQQAFPNLKVIVDAPLQMQRELQRLRREAGALDPADFEPMASAAGEALHALGLQMDGAVEYSKGQLLLEGVKDDIPLAGLNQRLAASGYVAAMDGKSLRIQEGR